MLSQSKVQCWTAEPFCRGESAIETDDHTLAVVEIDVKDRRYGHFVASNPKALVFHHSGWLSSLQAEYDTGLVVLGCENRNGELVGVLPLLRTRGIPLRIGAQQTGRRFSSLPRTPLAGPLFTSEDAGKLLLQEAANRARAERAQLQIKARDQLPATAVGELVCTNWRPTYVLEIPERREDLRFGDARTRHNLKWGVKKAEQNGITVRLAKNESEVIAWYSLYLEAMRRNCVPPRPLRLFVAMWRNLASQGIMRLHLAEQAYRQRLVAGSIFLTFGDTIWYAFTGIADRDLTLHANDLILWHAIHAACGSGVRCFNFGEVSEDHPELVRFKTKWGARAMEQYRYYSSDPAPQNNGSKSKGRAMHFANKVWQRLPLRITQQLGDLIYSRL